MSAFTYASITAPGSGTAYPFTGRVPHRTQTSKPHSPSPDSSFTSLPRKISPLLSQIIKVTMTRITNIVADEQRRTHRAIPDISSFSCSPRTVTVEVLKAKSSPMMGTEDAMFDISLVAAFSSEVAAGAAIEAAAEVKKVKVEGVRAEREKEQILLETERVMRGQEN
ncbi:hypothetical protein BDZ91DRAFT_802468 [Kalaharituber pfeilii]|nr:hypothetical protein BDZ91DRAFT_802468 [Kalaharituber pfeilii]